MPRRVGGVLAAALFQKERFRRGGFQAVRKLAGVVGAKDRGEHCTVHSPPRLRGIRVRHGERILPIKLDARNGRFQNEAVPPLHDKIDAERAAVVVAAADIVAVAAAALGGGDPRSENGSDRRRAPLAAKQIPFFFFELFPRNAKNQ